MFKFIVLSDLHLVPDPAGLTCSLNPAERLELAVNHVNDRHADAAFCVLAGDLADDRDRGAYVILHAALVRLKIPVLLTLGNHDDREMFAEVFAGQINAVTGRADHARDQDGYRVVVLDTLRQDHGGGEMVEAQFAWLAQRLEEAADRPVILVSHHGIANLGTPLDFIGFGQKQRLADMLTAHGDVRQFISGHVHMSSSGVYRGIPFTTISGSHYSIYPELKGAIPDIPRLAGPAQMGVVLADADGVVVHQENFVDAHAVLSAEYFLWDTDT